MTEAAISTLKNHLPELVHQAEKGEDIQITRHGKPVAVIVSLERYNHAFATGRGIYNASQHWRKQYPDSAGFSDTEVQEIHQRSREPHAEKTSVWE